jgi:hypothetical protein
MKLKITLKDPDGVYESIKNAVDSTDFEFIEEQCKPWIKYGEYVTIEIDTDAGTATVCKV